MIIRAFIVLGIVFTIGRADILGGEIDFGIYGHSRDITTMSSSNTIEINEDFTEESKADIFLRAYLEHPIPILHNIRVGYSSFSDIENIDIYDIALYYEILDNWISIDTGVNIRHIKGSFKDYDSTDFEFTLPTIYTKFRFDVPTTDLSFQVEGDYIDYSDKSLYDFEFGMRYGFLLGFALEAGYKVFEMQFDTIDSLRDMELNYDGFYGKVIWDF